MAAPSFTQNAQNNLASGVSIAASSVASPVTVDLLSKFAAALQFDILTGGSAQAGAVATVKIYRLFGSGPTSDTVPVFSFQIALGATSTHFIQSVELGWGKYAVTVTNGDTANAISYSLTSTTLDAVS